MTLDDLIYNYQENPNNGYFNEILSTLKTQKKIEIDFLDELSLLFLRPQKKIKESQRALLFSKIGHHYRFLSDFDSSIDRYLKASNIFDKIYNKTKKNSIGWGEVNFLRKKAFNLGEAGLSALKGRKYDLSKSLISSSTHIYLIELCSIDNALEQGSRLSIVMRKLKKFEENYKLNWEFGNLSLENNYLIKAVYFFGYAGDSALRMNKRNRSIDAYSKALNIYQSNPNLTKISNDGFQNYIEDLREKKRIIEEKDFSSNLRKNFKIPFSVLR